MSEAEVQIQESVMHQFSTFRLAERLFGVNILDVKEVTQETVFTPVFHAPSEVKGYVNIRGQVHLVLDLSLLLGFEETKVSDSSRVVLFKPTVGDNFGVLVDAVGDVVEVDEKSIENRRKDENTDKPSDQRRVSEIGVGVCKLEKELLIVLNAVNMLKAV